MRKLCHVELALSDELGNIVSTNRETDERVAVIRAPPHLPVDHTVLALRRTFHTGCEPELGNELAKRIGTRKAIRHRTTFLAKQIPTSLQLGSPQLVLDSMARVHSHRFVEDSQRRGRLVVPNSE